MSYAELKWRVFPISLLISVTDKRRFVREEQMIFLNEIWLPLHVRVHFCIPSVTPFRKFISDSTSLSFLPLALSLSITINQRLTEEICISWQILEHRFLANSSNPFPISSHRSPSLPNFYNIIYAIFFHYSSVSFHFLSPTAYFNAFLSL